MYYCISLCVSVCQVDVSPSRSYVTATSSALMETMRSTVPGVSAPVWMTSSAQPLDTVYPTHGSVTGQPTVLMLQMNEPVITSVSSFATINLINLS